MLLGVLCKLLKRMLKLFFILIISIQPFLISTVNAQGENIVKNPGFEEGDTHSPNFWYTHSWNKEEGRSEFFLDETQFHTGNRSACIINNKDNDSRYKQNIKVKGNTYYRISCWVKTENVKSNIKGANLSLEGSTDTSRDVRGTSSNWEYIELYGKSSPNQESFTLTVGLGGHGNINTGKAWFDDIEVVELDTLPPGKTAINLIPTTQVPIAMIKPVAITPITVILSLFQFSSLLPYLLLYSSCFLKTRYPVLKQNSAMILLMSRAT